MDYLKRKKRYIVCPGCENCDEEIEFGYFDPSRRIEKADLPVKKWDDKSRNIHHCSGYKSTV